MTDDLLAQLAYEPHVRQPLARIPATLVVGGMGGSALGGDALAFLFPERHIIVHRGYGLPAFPPPDALYLAVSYSGATEETVSFASDAARAGLPLAIVSSGGTLASFAEREGLPYASVPTGRAPRNALIYLVKALLALIGESRAGEEFAALSIDAAALAERAEVDAHFMLPSVPLFYSSERNACLARIGKLVMNETARMPAFSNAFPELNHNEMQAFDTEMPEGLEHLFRFVLIADADDDPRIRRRMDAFTSLMEERGKHVELAELSGSRASVLAHWWLRMLGAGRLLAETRGIDPDTAPLVESFKKLI